MNTTQRRTYGWRTWSDPLRDALIGVVIGVVVTMVESGATREFPRLETFVRNAMLGMSITLASRGLETMLSWAIEQSRIPTIFRCVVYAMGGWMGFFVGLVVVAAVIAPGDTDFQFGTYHFLYSLGAAILGSITAGLVIHHNRKRNDRLLASLQRLAEHEFAEKELEIAREMQQRLLPPPVIERDGFRVTAHTEAAHLVGGDFYDVLRLDDEHTAILIADVSGKGIAASLVMASCKAVVPFLASSGDAASVMNALNRQLCEQLQRREFVAMLFARYTQATGELEMVNAGMPDPLVVSNGETREVTFAGDRLPLGAMRNTRYESTSLTLAPGERLVLFSDGLPEAFVGEVHLGYEHVETLARRHANVEALTAEVRATPNLRIDDDLTLLMLERA